MFYYITKRIFDVVLSIIFLIIFSPILFLTIIAIKIDSKGKILADTPRRLGKDGKQFKMYKFRSMVQNAHNILTTDPKYKELYEEYKRSGYKLKNDPRITKIGKIIRKYSIDEVPQFLNVMKGEMSIVGPRAYYPDELVEQQEKYPDTHDAVRVVLSVKPGITGVWQVSGRSEINFDKRIKMDAMYAKRKSVFYDVYIIFRTPFAMFSGKGAM